MTNYKFIKRSSHVTLLDPPSQGGRKSPFEGGLRGDENLQHNLSHRHRIILRIDEMHKMKSIEMDNPNTFKQIGSGFHLHFRFGR
jgi:hypothetical protein